MKAAWDFFLGTPDKPGFIKVVLPDGRPIRDRFVFDTALAQSSFFDPNAKLTAQQIPSQMPFMSGWGALDHFAERPFAELFTDCFGTNADDVKCYIIARKPPWLGHLTYPENKGASVTFSTGKRPGFGGSLFDRQFGEWDLQSQTVEIDGSDVIGTPSLRRGIDREIYNTFQVLPQIGSNGSGNSISDQLLQHEIPPIIDEDPESPSYILRYGVRPYPTQQSKYIPVSGPDGSSPLAIGDLRRHAVAYTVLLHEWHKWLPEMWSGTYVLKGRTGLRVGRRLVDKDRKREFYITGVTHHMVIGTERPTYTTTVQVERGWNLA